MPLWPRSYTPHKGSFYGIQGIVVPPDQRAAFNQLGPLCVVNSATAEADPTRRKRLEKLWQTAGFDEHLLPDGTLVFQYNHQVYIAQKKQQADNRGS